MVVAVHRCGWGIAGCGWWVVDRFRRWGVKAVAGCGWVGRRGVAECGGWVAGSLVAVD